MGQTWLNDEALLNESDELDFIRKELADIRRDFARAKEKLYRRTQSYFNQGVESNYTKEEVLHEMIDECAKLKKKFRLLQEREKLLRELSQ